MGILKQIFSKLFFILYLLGTVESFAQSPQAYFSMSLEDLMNIEVTSAAKHQQKLSDVAAAIYVITEEDISHSGAENVAELLRMVPGIQVARVGNNSWAVSVRGFNSRFSNKLLVLIDGRSIYSPIFSGVFWERQNIPLDLIERIEVVRGPGGSLWGANAVNGVINIITKKAEKTQGRHIEGLIGSPEQFRTATWAGSSFHDEIFSRIYVNALDRDGFETTSGKDAKEDFQAIQTGFRTDWVQKERDTVSISADLFYGEMGVRSVLPSFEYPYHKIKTSESDILTGNILFNITHAFTNDHKFKLQAYYDLDNNNAYFLGYRVDTFDLEAQYDLDFHQNNHLVTGLGFRHIKADFDSTWYTKFSPETHKDDIFNFFLQDEIALLEDKGHLTIGTKFEHNPYTGLEIQPSVKFLWKKDSGKILWASIAKAVHTPDISMVGTKVPVHVVRGSLLNVHPILISYKGNSHFDSEVLWAYEAGFRNGISSSATFDINLFLHRYSRLLATVYSYETAVQHQEPIDHQEIFVKPANKMRGEVWGMELALRYKINEWWSVKGSYTYTKMYLHPKGTITRNLDDKDFEGRVPEQMFYAQSTMFLSNNIDVDMVLRYMDSLPSLSIPSYWEADIKVKWRPRKNLEISFAGQNLLDEAHPEFNSDFLSQEMVEIQRTFYAKVSWHF